MQRLEKAVDRSSLGLPVQPLYVPYDTGRIGVEPVAAGAG